MAGIPTFEPPTGGNDFFQTNYTGGIQGTLETGGNTYAAQFDSGSTSFEDEPPLLEELGINFRHIFQKTLAVLTPFRKMDSSLHISDDDLAGPLVFASLFAAFLLLTGKMHFGAIYGICATGSIAVYILMNLMSEQGITIYTTVSVLGYCLLPMTLLAFFSLAIPLIGVFGIILTALCVIWCTFSASSMFVTALAMVDQRILVAYPLMLFYTCFALFTMF